MAGVELVDAVAAQDATKFVALGASLQARVSEEGKGGTAELVGISLELGMAWSSGNRRQPANLRLGFYEEREGAMEARISGRRRSRLCRP